MSAPTADTPSPNPEITRLETEIAELKRQWPKHSVPSALLMRLEELEDELAVARDEQDRADADAES